MNFYAFFSLVLTTHRAVSRRCQLSCRCCDEQRCRPMTILTVTFTFGL